MHAAKAKNTSLLEQSLHEAGIDPHEPIQQLCFFNRTSQRPKPPSSEASEFCWHRRESHVSETPVAMQIAQIFPIHIHSLVPMIS
jgi:hypothetical protein